MKQKTNTLFKSYHVFDSTPERRQQACFLLKVFKQKADKHPLSAFLLRATQLPLGPELLIGIHQANRKQFKKHRWLQIVIGTKSPHSVIIPNVFRGLPPKIISSFVGRPESEILADLRARILINEKATTIKDLGRIFEALAPNRFDTTIFSIANNRLDYPAAQPDRILLCDGECHTFVLPKRRGVVKRGGYDEYFHIIGKMAKSVDELEGCKHEGAMQELDELAVNPSSQGIAASIASACYDDVAQKAGLDSMVRILSSIPKIVEAILTNAVPDKVSPADLRALGLIQKYDKKISIPIDFAAAIKARVDIQPRPFDLTSPTLVFNYYELEDSIHVDVNNTQACAQRLYLDSLAYDGLRPRCMRDVKLRHFDIEKGFEQLLIPTTKVKSMKNRIIPLHYMWPDAELEFLKIFLENHQDDLDKRLLDLAFGEAENDKGSYASWWKAWIGLKRRSVNLPRTVFATWLPIRALVAFDPWLLDECPELAVARQHWWFSEEGLEKIRRYFKSEAHCLLEVFRPMQGWSRNHEILSTYCRSWALIMELERLKLLRRSKEFFAINS